MMAFRTTHRAASAQGLQEGKKKEDSQRKASRASYGAQDGLRGLPRTLPGLAPSPAGAPAQHIPRPVSQPTVVVPCYAASKVEITNLGQGRALRQSPAPAVQRSSATDPAGCRMALGASAPGLTRDGLLWAPGNCQTSA